MPVHLVEVAPEHEHQIRQAVEVLARAVVDGFFLREADEHAFGAAADGAAQVGLAGGAGAAGEDEVLERGEVFVPGVERGFEFVDLFGRDHAHAGDAHFAAQIEQVVLHVGEQGAHVVGQGFGEQHADAGVEFVDFAQRVDAQAVLGDAVAVAEAGGAGVAGAGVNLGEAVSHDGVLWLIEVARL